MMKCPYCGEEMVDGYLISSTDISFSTDDPEQFFRIKKRNDLELSTGSGLSIPHCAACHCSRCKKLVIDYGNE